MSTVTELLQQLIRIPSVNPEGDPGTDRTGEADCARFIADYLKTCGAETELRDVLPGRPNVLGRFPSDRPDKPRLLFAPHTDTVSVRGMTVDPFGGEIREGKIWGRGASDTKGSAAAMLDALSAMRDIIPRLSHEIWFAGLMSEETGQYGSKALAAQEKFDFVVVGEPTNLKTVHTHKGSLWLVLKGHGIAVHASTPDLGRNAIEPVMEALLFLKKDFQRTFGDLHHPVLGPTTINIGTIQGGSKVNIVPEACEAWVDIRTLPDQEADAWVESIRKKFPEVEISARGSKPLFTAPDHEVIRLLQDCGSTLTGAPWFCDAAWFSAVGTPAVAIGPGSIAQAHTADEFITIADLEAGTAFFQKFLQKLLPA